MGVALGDIAVSVTLEIASTPPVVEGATLTVHCRTAEGDDAGAVVERALAASTVANSVRRGFPVDVRSR